VSSRESDVNRLAEGNVIPCPACRARALKHASHLKKINDYEGDQK
jgi:hypothetical protein